MLDVIDVHGVLLLKKYCKINFFILQFNFYFYQRRQLKSSLSRNIGHFCNSIANKRNSFIEKGLHENIETMESIHLYHKLYQ